MRTIARYDYSIAGVDRDVIQKLKTAGYPQLNQVQHTAFNRVELLNLNVESIRV